MLIPICSPLFFPLAPRGWPGVKSHVLIAHMVFLVTGSTAPPNHHLNMTKTLLTLGKFQAFLKFCGRTQTKPRVLPASFREVLCVCHTWPQS